MTSPSPKWRKEVWMCKGHPSSRGRRRELERWHSEERDAFGYQYKQKDKYAPKLMSTPYCPQCKKEKMQFATEREALRYIEMNYDRIVEQKGVAPTRAYYCTSCGCYHVTSKPKRTFNLA